MSARDESTQSSDSSHTQDHGSDSQPQPRLDRLPAVFILPTHLGIDELHESEKLLEARGATLTYEIAEACVILGAVATVRRAKFELNTRNVRAEILEETASVESAAGSDVVRGKRKRDDEGSELIHETAIRDDPFSHQSGIAKIIKLEWLYASIKRKRVLSFKDYLVCKARISKPGWSESQPARATPSPKALPDVVKVSNLDGSSEITVADLKYTGRKFLQAHRSIAHGTPTFTRETTSEHEQALQQKLPPTPGWARDGKVYACERVTPMDSPNSELLDLLEKIRLSRILIEDEIGVRAYSTSIASLAAYPYKLVNVKEIDKLPGCDQKIEALFREYQSTGQITAAKAIENDPALRVIQDFYNIWGVGAKTAREWYFDRGWRDHDDIIQYGWNHLSRVQQIGLKFFEEFELKIPRAEVASIASVVHAHGKALLDDELTCTIVGGYRRGKSESGDVDIILSHPEEEKTHYFISQLLAALEASGWITHTLTLSEANSQRDQAPLGLRLGSAKGGFDTLDKALLVWQDPDWPGKEGAQAIDPMAKNPNVHRRVDIIVSPWRTIGCAITGWSSGTTFQRDLRRYVKHQYGWKFDSSGVRDRKTGRWIDLERWSDPSTRAKTPIEAERRVFEGMGLEYRHPSERCTR